MGGSGKDSQRQYLHCSLEGEEPALQRSGKEHSRVRGNSADPKRERPRLWHLQGQELHRVRAWCILSARERESGGGRPGGAGSLREQGAWGAGRSRAPVGGAKWWAAQQRTIQNPQLSLCRVKAKSREHCPKSFFNTAPRLACKLECVLFSGITISQPSHPHPLVSFPSPLHAPPPPHP